MKPLVKPLVIYHDNCADGFASAFAAWLTFGSTADYLPVQYGPSVDPLQSNPPDGRDVYVLDFSFPRHQMDELLERANRVVWLDHHKTAFEMWCGRYERGMQHVEGDAIVLDDNKSGAMLTWEWFHNTEAPLFIRYIDDTDRWQFKRPGSREFARALWSYAPWSFEQWSEFFYPSGRSFAAPYDDFIDQGKAILRAHDQNVGVVTAAARSCTLRWDHRDVAEVASHRRATGLATNAPPFLASDAGHVLATRSGTFGLVWYLDADNVVRCSLRSNGDYDVSAIAKALGGGGHKNAAGFATDLESLQQWLSIE